MSACPGASTRRYVCGEDLMACLWRLHPAFGELLGVRSGIVFCEAEDIRILVLLCTDLRAAWGVIATLGACC